MSKSSTHRCWDHHSLNTSWKSRKGSKGSLGDLRGISFTSVVPTIVEPDFYRVHIYDFLDLQTNRCPVWRSRVSSGLHLPGPST